MRDIKSPALLYAKGALFLGVGLLSSTLLLLDRPTPKTALLLALSAWGFARAYYFAFYVVEHYVDGAYRFAGLASFARYVLVQRNRTARAGADDTRYDGVPKENPPPP